MLNFKQFDHTNMFNHISKFLAQIYEPWEMK
jgi:hypothetical protein